MELSKAPEFAQPLAEVPEPWSELLTAPSMDVQYETAAATRKLQLGMTSPRVRVHAAALVSIIGDFRGAPGFFQTPPQPTPFGRD